MARTPRSMQTATLGVSDAATPQSDAPLPTGTLTFCFTDIEGSTQLWEQRPQAMPLALARHDAILRDAIQSQQGVIFKTVGDGVHSVFARATDALEAALAAQRALAIEPWHALTQADGAQPPNHIPTSAIELRVRMALHSGVAEQRGGDYFGPTLNRVARILDLGHGGQILLSHTSHDLVADQLPEQSVLRALGEYQLKDLARPEKIFQLVSPDLPTDFPPLRTFGTPPAPAGPTSQLLTTKLYLPPARFNLVPRPRLIERLQAGLSSKLTLIAAPAGFGKTTLVSAWLSQLRIENEKLQTFDQDNNSQFKVAWVALDKGDNDPMRFWSYVIAALDTLDAGIGTSVLVQLQSPQPPPIESILTTLLNTLGRWNTPVVLVLDDYHAIDTPSIHQALAFLLDHMPPQLHLVLASRADPPLPLSRLRARGELIELRAADLRFTPEETTAFLTAVMGVRLPAEAVAALETRTEGWIAGLQFAALAMRDRTDHTSFIAAFTGSNRFVMDYLLEEVLNHLPRHLHSFLLETSILDRLSGSLCDALLGLTPDEGRTTNDQSSAAARDRSPSSFALRPSSDSYSQLILDQLERANLFLVPLDDDRHWYRYHPLFAEVLRSRLTSGASAAHVATLHHRASVWFEQHGLEIEAVGQALAADDRERTARLIEQYTWPVAYRGQIHTVLGWFNALPAAFIRTHPTLCMLHSQMLMHTNQLDAAESRLREAEQALLPDAPEELAHSIQGRVLTTRANISFYQGDLPRSVLLGQQALDILPESANLWRPAAKTFAAHAFLVSGDVTAPIERQVAAVAPAAAAAGNRFVQLRGYTLLAEFQVLQGQLQTAATTYRQVAHLAPEPGVLSSMVGSAAYYFGLGDLYREWNDLDAAEQLLLEGMQCALGMVTANAVYLRQGCVALARLQHARGDHTAAMATLARLADLGRQRAFDSLVQAQGRAVQAQLSLARGNLGAAVQWADTSGLRADDPISFARELEHLTFVRVLIAKGRGDPTAPWLCEALALLERMLETAEASERLRSVLEIMILRALVLAAQGDPAAANRVLERALALARPEGYVRIFVDEGAPMQLQIADCRLQVIQPNPGPASHDRERLLAYMDTLLSHFGLPIANFGLNEAPPIVHPKSQIQNLAEPLSERELEVLALIAAGHSNQAIADTLIIAVSTAKRHINNIYGKLDVQSRTQALARARELRLL